MKEIKAYIKPHKLQDVTLALHKVEGLTGMSTVDVRGFGRDQGQDELVDFVPHVKIELVCPDSMVEELISTIQKAAHTGLPGDGKIYVSAVETVVRIETGERSEGAV